MEQLNPPICCLQEICFTERQTKSAGSEKMGHGKENPK